jgi:hypothetical protein
MATLPGASVSISSEAGVLAGGTGYCVVISPVAQNADGVPRVFTSFKSLLAQHGYSQGADYAASHIDATRKPVLFCGIPIATAGVISQNDQSGVTGTSAITVAAGSDGVLDEVDAVLTVTTGGTVGTTGIKFTISMDGGRSTVNVNLGTATSYTVPYLGIVISFAAGTLVAGDVFTFVTSAPMWDSAGLALARAGLVAQQKLARSWMVIGDIDNATFAGYVTTQVNGYETANARFTYARVNAFDRLPLPKKSKVVGQTLTFAEVGVTGDTITRSAGSWIDDGFKVGDDITISGSVSNDITTVAGIASLTATVITLDTDDLVDEATTASEDVSITVAETMAAWISRVDTALASIDGQKRIDIGVGRARRVSQITNWVFRRPASWHASIREYQHDIHRTTWRKDDGPLKDVTISSADGSSIEEYDDRVVGGALAGRFTCLRTWSNGPAGPFVAISLTREDEGSLLSYTHNMAVANVACTIVQDKTENVVGRTLVLKSDGTATTASLSALETEVNNALETALLEEKVVGEGPRCSSVVWRANTTDNLSVVDATLTGSVDLRVNGTVVHVDTAVRVS